MDRNEKPKTSNKPKQRLVTLGMLGVSLLLYFLMQSGLLGETLEQNARFTLSVMLLLTGMRALVTELGLRK